MDAVRRAHQLKRENLQRGNEAHSALPTSNASSMSSPVAPTEPSHDDDMVTPFLTNGQRNYGSNTSNGTPPPRLPRSGTTLWRIARSKLLPTYNNSNYLLESKRTIKGLTVTLQRPTPCTSVINDDHMSCWAGACVLMCSLFKTVQTVAPRLLCSHRMQERFCSAGCQCAQ